MFILTACHPQCRLDLGKARSISRALLLLLFLICVIPCSTKTTTENTQKQTNNNKTPPFIFYFLLTSLIILAIVAVGDSLLLFSSCSYSFAVHGTLTFMCFPASVMLYAWTTMTCCRYIGAYVDCPLPTGDNSLPFAVSVDKGDECLGHNYMIIHYSHSQSWLRQRHYGTDTSASQNLDHLQTFHIFFHFFYIYIFFVTALP